MRVQNKILLEKLSQWMTLTISLSLQLGKTPLHDAAAHGQDQSCKVLLKARALTNIQDGVSIPFAVR